MAKTKQELSDMKSEDLVEYVASLSADVDKKNEEAKSAMDNKDDEHKTAMDDKEHETKTAMEDEKKNHEAVMKAVLKAMDEDDHEKRKEAVKSAMEDNDHKEKEATVHGTEDDDNEKKALKAEVTYLANKIKKPQIQYLKRVYEASLTDEATIKKYETQWNEKTAQQLDAEIEKIAPLVRTLTETSQLDASIPSEISIPMQSTLPTSSHNTYKGSVDLSKISKMSDKDLFRSRR